MNVDNIIPQFNYSNLFFSFMAGKYKELDMSGLKLSKTRDYAVYLALKSSGQGIGEKVKKYFLHYETVLYN